MKLQNTLMLIAKGSTVDKQDGSLSIFKIFTRFNFGLNEEQKAHIADEHTAEKPHLLNQQYVFVSSWMPEVSKRKSIDREPMGVVMEIVTEDPHGEEVAKQTINAEVAFGESPFNININLASVPVTGEGVYEMTMRIINPASNKEMGKASTSYTVAFVETQN